MAYNLLIRVHKIDDLTLVQTCRAVHVALNEFNPTCTLSFLPGIPTALEEIESEDGLTGRYAFQTASIQATIADDISITLTFQRTIKVANIPEPSATYDEFDLAFGRDQNRWRGHPELARSLIEIVSSVDLPTSSSGSPVDGESGTLRELLVGFGAVHRQMLESLNSSIAEIENKRAEVETEFQEKEQERTAAHQASLDELAEERKKLSLQSHMSERRALLQAMTDNTAANTRKSMAPRGAIYSRWGVFIAAIALAGLAGWLAYTSIVQLTVSEAAVSRLLSSIPENADQSVIKDIVSRSVAPTNWYLISRSILSSLAALGALVYAATWLRGFYNAEVSAAREIDRFNYDLSRASWIIETVLEVQHEQKGDVPDAWINGVTRGLFENSGSSSHEDDGTQALRALLGYSAAASFGPEGPKFELKQKNARKLAKDVDAEP